MHGGIGVAVLTDDGNGRMPSRCRLGELHIHVGDVADIRENPDLRLSGLALDDRLEQPVDGELHVALRIGQRRIGRHAILRLAVEGRELLKIARNELKQSADIVDRQRPGIPHCESALADLRLREIDWRQRRAVPAIRKLATFRCCERADELRPVGIVELCEPALRSNT
jgi:hypothetical protein